MLKIASYIPNKIVSNDEFESLGWSPKKIYSKTGIRERRVSNEDETALDMSVNACENLFHEYNIDRNIVDYVIYCTQSPDFVIPNNSSILHYRLNLKTSCATVDINQGCTGFLYSLSLAKGILSSKQAKNVLIITTDTYTKYINIKDRANRTIFGDASSATLLNEEDLNKLGTFIFGTDGSGAFNLCVKTSGLKYPKNSLTCIENEDDSGNIRSEDNLYMNGGEIFSFTLEKVPESVNEVLKANNLQMFDIDFFVFHQANGFMLTHLRNKMEIADEKFLIVMEHTGNTVSSSIPLALKELISLNKLIIGQKLMLVGFGVGYSWSATILEV
jgi:3-oxoacyl-[acyl-carrier-protein] synthase-3